MRTILNFIDRFSVGWLGVGALVAVAIVLGPSRPGRTAEPYSGFLDVGYFDVKIRCHPAVLYKGDDLVVEFGSPHTDFDFGIWPIAGISPTATARTKPGEVFLFSFNPGKNDDIEPVIPPEDFSSMRRIRLSTATARGSLSNLWRGDEVRRALKPPELIFTASGSYEVLLGAGLGDDDVPFGACWVEYIDHEKQSGAALEKEALGELMRSTFKQAGCEAKILETAVRCPATTVYRGEALALKLDSENPAGRIGIVDPDWNIFLLPAEKNSASDPSGVLTGVRIVAGYETARAVSYESAARYGERSKYVETKSGSVFAKSGWYIAISVPGPECDSAADVGACWIHYVDAPPPR